VNTACQRAPFDCCIPTRALRMLLPAALWPTNAGILCSVVTSTRSSEIVVTTPESVRLTGLGEAAFQAAVTAFEPTSMT
jgi:hypothetical protein